jgi:diguanylate cyclase (GGDEF)-like protein
MAFDLVHGRRSHSVASLLVTILSIAVIAGVVTPAFAGRSTFRTYNIDQGLTSLGGDCLVQDGGGFLLVCTESGLFSYDGRRFDNLGPEQGLRQGGYVYDVTTAPSGRIAIRFADEVMIADRATDRLHSPRSLVFHAVSRPGLNFFEDRKHRLVAWHGGFALLADDNLERIVLPDGGPPKMELVGYDAVERSQLSGATSVFSAHDHLWLAFEDGRLCTADPGQVKCYGAADGLHAGRFVDVVAGDGDTVLARSASSVATFTPISGSPAAGTWSVVTLPDQGVRYVGYVWSLGLFRTPDGGFITQADHGLAVLGPQGWRLLSVNDGAPSGTIVSSMTDRTGQLWFQIFGIGLKRWVGYGRWETFQKSDGLSEGIAWKTARTPNGSVWISTDTGIDEIVRQGVSLKLSKVWPGSSYAIAADARGALWSGDGNEGASVIDPVTGAVTKLSMPAVNAIFPGQGDDVWFGTRAGLFKIDDRPGYALRPRVVASARTSVKDVTGDSSGGVFYLSSGRLRHYRHDGTDVPVVETWPDNGFEPVSLASDHNGGLWVGGAGGLYRFNTRNDHVLDTLSVPASDTRANSVVAVMVDHRGWVWAGTSLGVSVFNGQRWVSLDVDSGLASNDVDEGGIREDPDGSVWITTAEGVSHLLDASWLFAQHPVQAVISAATLGQTAVSGTMPYSQDALVVQFGTPNYGVERSVTFRYSLSGVDTGMAASPSGLVRYPSVPPGHHVLTVVAYDDMTHETSAPASFVVDIAYPWWRQWWAEFLVVAGGLGVAYGAMWLRFRAIMARQSELRRCVAEATELLRYDGLTGLLNRREIEKHLAEKLSKGCIGDETVIALLDVDHFKQVNDAYGHLGGDDVLRSLGRLVQADIWAGECAGRYGGEEILLVLDDGDGRGAERVLHLLHTIRGTPFNAAGKSIRVTCSIGLAWAVPGDDWESLIGRADNALYEAKSSGRDRVVEKGRRAWSASSGWASTRSPALSERHGPA